MPTYAGTRFRPEPLTIIPLGACRAETLPALFHVAPAVRDPIAHPLLDLPLASAHRATAQRDRAGKVPLHQSNVDRAPRQARAGHHLREPQEPPRRSGLAPDHTRHRSVLLTFTGRSWNHSVLGLVVLGLGRGIRPGVAGPGGRPRRPGVRDAERLRALLTVVIGGGCTFGATLGGSSGEYRCFIR